MNIATLDTLLGRLQRVGQAGSLPKNMTVPQLVDELQRELGALADAVKALCAELRAGPRYPKDSNIFLVDCSASGNLLTSAQANKEGIGAIDGLAVYRHGLGFNLDRYVIVHQAITPVVGVSVTGQAQRSGGLVLFAYDANRTIFQADQEAVTNGAKFVVSCYPSKVVPSSTTNPGANSKTGSFTPQLGTISAISASGLP